MKFRNTLLTTMLLGSLNSFSQENKLNIYSDVASFLGVQPSIGYVESGPNSIEASFLLGAYNVKMENLNDSVYQETITKSFPLKKAKEVFSYVKRDGAYNFVDYDVLVGERRVSKDSILSKNYSFSEGALNPVDLMKEMFHGKIDGKVNFFIFANDISVDVRKQSNGSSVSYYVNLEDMVKNNGENAVLFDSDVEVDVSGSKINGFSTSFRIEGDKKRYYIKGKNKFR